MTPPGGMQLPMQVDLVQAIPFLFWVAYVFLVVSAALVGGLGLGWVTRMAFSLVALRLSDKALRRTRVVGGALAALLAILLLYPGGLGPGTESGSGEPESVAHTENARPAPAEDAQAGNNQAEPPPTNQQPVGKRILRILVLGDGTEPPYQPINKYFAWADSPTPEPMDAKEVMQHISKLRQTEEIREVELVLLPESTSLNNLEVQRLRRALHNEGLRLYIPPEPQESPRTKAP